MFNKNKTTMKKIYFKILLAGFFVLPMFSVAQENMVENAGLELWEDASTPTDWNVYENITQESAMVHSGDYSAAQTSPSSGSVKLRQNIAGVIPGTEYTISYWYLDNDPAAKSRIWSYWIDADGQTMAEDEEFLRPEIYSSDDPEWQQKVIQLTAPEGAAKLRFEVRTYKENGNGGKVYYDDFYFGTETTILPEPTNYPTNFTAETYKVFIDISWEDSQGGQLPTGYIIYCYLDTVQMPVPVDGEMPENDENIEDDGLAFGYVPYGFTEGRITDFPPGQHYNFVLYPYTNSGENIDYKTDGTPPTADATTENLNLLLYDDFEEDGFGSFTPHNVLGDQQWMIGSYNGNSFAKMNGYAAGAAHANEDWLISQPVNLTQGRVATLTFSNSKKYDGNDLELYVSTDYDGSGNPNDFTWTNLSDQATWSPGDYQWVTTEDLDLSAFAGQTVYIAFKYTSTDDAAALWKVDDVIVTETIATGIINSTLSTFHVYPNPATSFVQFDFAENGMLTLMDVSGKMVLQKPVVSGTNKLNLSGMHNGVYLAVIKTDNNKVYQSKIIVKK
jgi:hypothetical protein